MQTAEFLGRVQTAACLPTLDAAIKATRATLETLAERLGPDEARHLGDRLPHEIQLYLRGAATPVPERFSSDEFLERVCAREGVDLPNSMHHARAVIDVLTKAVSKNDMLEVVERLPDDYRRLFAGSEAEVPRR
jgi:uncharacterized protein (DUF2267 family)